MKQLKKSNLLAVITAEPMTRGEIVDALEEYEFIDSYLTFLIDHFEVQGKIIKNEDGTVQLKAKKVSAAASSTVYKVFTDEDGNFELKTCEIKDLPEDHEGWSKTEKRALKVASSAVFADYKAKVEAIKALATPVEETTDGETE